MKTVFTKGIISVLAFLFVIAPGAFYLTYTSSSSVLWSSLAVVVAYAVWKLLVGGGLNRRRKYVNRLLAEKFPESDDDPLGNDNSFFKTDWARGTGYTDEQDQPMCVKATEEGVLLFYLCWAVKKPFVVPWDRISQIKLSVGTYDNANQVLARLYISGLGMQVLVPWEQRFNKLIPERVGFSETSRKG